MNSYKLGSIDSNGIITATLNTPTFTSTSINISETADRITELENKVSKLEKLLEKYGIDIEEAEKVDLSE